MDESWVHHYDAETKILAWRKFFFLQWLDLCLYCELMVCWDVFKMQKNILTFTSNILKNEVKILAIYFFKHVRRRTKWSTLVLTSLWLSVMSREIATSTLHEQCEVRHIYRSGIDIFENCIIILFPEVLLPWIISSFSYTTSLPNQSFRRVPYRKGNQISI